MFKTLLVSVTLVIGAAIFYFSCVPTIASEIAKLEPHAVDVASVYSSYAFTVAGFLATIATFLYTLGGKPYFDLYRRRGSFSDLMWMHGLTMIVLASLFVVAILMHAYPEMVRLGSVLAVLSLFQLTSLTIISYRLAKRANET